MKTYTVILLYPDWVTPDYGQTFLGHVMAKDVQRAAKAAVDECLMLNALTVTLSQREDFRICCVIEGKHVDLWTHK